MKQWTHRDIFFLLAVFLFSSRLDAVHFFFKSIFTFQMVERTHCWCVGWFRLQIDGKSEMGQAGAFDRTTNVVNVNRVEWNRVVHLFFSFFVFFSFGVRSPIRRCRTKRRVPPNRFSRVFFIFIIFLGIEFSTQPISLFVVKKWKKNKQNQRFVTRISSKNDWALHFL